MSASEEMRQYIDGHYPEALKKDFDIADFWARNSEKFPRLSKFARSIVPVPGATACCERSFSALGNLVTDSRERLSGDTVSNIILAKYLIDLDLFLAVFAASIRDIVFAIAGVFPIYLLEVYRCLSLFSEMLL